MLAVQHGDFLVECHAADDAFYLGFVTHQARGISLRRGCRCREDDSDDCADSTNVHCLIFVFIHAFMLIRIGRSMHPTDGNCIRSLQK